MRELTLAQTNTLEILGVTNQTAKVIGWSAKDNGPVVSYNGRGLDVVTQDGNFKEV